MKLSYSLIGRSVLPTLLVFGGATLTAGCEGDDNFGIGDAGFADDDGNTDDDDGNTDDDDGNTDDDDGNTADAGDGGDADGGEGGDTDGGEGGVTDGGNVDGGNVDGGVTDGGVTDGGVTDGGVTDGGVTDGGDADGGDAGEAGPGMMVGMDGGPVMVADGGPTAPADSGTTPVAPTADSGTTPSVDSGTMPPVDPPVVDSGADASTDSGAPATGGDDASVDSGTPTMDSDAGMDASMPITPISLDAGDGGDAAAADAAVEAGADAGADAAVEAGADAAPPPPVCEIDDDVIGWWRAEGNGNNEAGGAAVSFDGTFVDGTNGISTEGQAFAFDGSQFVEAVSAFSVPTTGLSVDAFINPSSAAPNTTQFIVAQWGDLGESFALAATTRSQAAVVAAGADDCVFAEGLGIYMRVRTDQGTVVACSNIAVPAADEVDGGVSAGGFVHVAGTFEPSTGTVSVYVDGVIAGSSSLGVPATVIDVDAPVQVGARSAANRLFFTGAIDEVGVFSSVLTPDEVADNRFGNIDPGTRCVSAP